MKKVFFTNSQNQRLCGLFSGPRDKQKTILLMAHGLSINKDNPFFLALSENLASRGLASFRFDFSGHGESEGKFENITLTQAIDDLLHAFAYLKSTSHQKIGLLGESFGGAASLLAAPSLKKLSFLILKSPVSDYLKKEQQARSPSELENWQKTGFRYYQTGRGQKLKLNYAFFEDLRRHHGYLTAPKIDVPTLIVHGDRDEIVSSQQSIKTSRLIPHCRLHLIKGADHRYSQPDHFQECLSTISQFILNKKSPLSIRYSPDI